ncbi:ABC transporter ATP-binding protein [Desulfosporosinus shakirovi]|uniref:ABC transporter ATP-binding protein n=1 Tax=Desulfosporosinus shakirovi TaxID=2885154 RepID=UPI001E2E6136|nr:ABC transporter ATP-binding protein [Desulfosporosinus sp. SRJS8]MCB8816714.1 ABC transporter ATP-binding protein/permease [Desulfosporosinus sp. SRJS8]
MKIEKAEDENENKSGLGYLLGMVGSNKNFLYLAIGFSIISGLCTFVPYVMVYKTVLFLFNGAGRMSEVMGYGLIAAVSIVLRFIFQAVSLSLTHIGAYNTLYVVRKRLCAHIGEISLGFFGDNSSGEIKKVLIEDVERIEKFLAHQIPDIVVAIIVPITVLIYLLTVNVAMALFLLVPVVLTIGIQVLIVVGTKSKMRVFNGLSGKLNSVIIQFINGMPVMKTFNLTADSYRDYSETIGEYNRVWKELSRMAAPIAAVCTVIIESGIAFTLPLGGYLYLTQRLELSAFVFFMIMSMVFLNSYSNLLSFAQVFTQISSGLERIKEIMDIPAALGRDAELAKEGSYDVEFKNVTFAYDKQEVLRDINITLPRGSLTAFVGASGAGKTTAAQLIPKFWQVSRGEITIGGINVENLKNENLMNLVSFVFQETFMLNGTIYENIAIGKGDCTRREVETAAQAAQIHDFITGLPQGYETYLGDKGIKLSGGEKQRICIARAILKNAPIIIFDEATSFSDIENECKIQLALSNLLKDKTTVMIAHRLQTIVKADQICVFDEGEIKEIGSHGQLLKKDGLYKRMWRIYTGTGKEAAAV